MVLLSHTPRTEKMLCGVKIVFRVLVNACVSESPGSGLRSILLIMNSRAFYSRAYGHNIPYFYLKFLLKYGVHNIFLLILR
jgi:hypothetical protein